MATEDPVDAFVENVLNPGENEVDTLHTDQDSMAMQRQWLRREMQKHFMMHMAVAAEQERVTANAQYLDMREQQLRARENNVLMREQQLGIAPDCTWACSAAPLPPPPPPGRQNRRRSRQQHRSNAQ